jgi:hypothetical protein
MLHIMHKLSILRDANGDLTALNQAATESDNQADSDQEEDNGLVVHDDSDEEYDMPLATLLNR